MNASNPFTQSPWQSLEQKHRQQGQSFEMPSFDQVRTPSSSRGGDSLMPPPDLSPLFEQASRQHGVPINVLMALAQQESSYRPNAIGEQTQWGRAKGIMQYIDDTARAVGINPLNPAEAIDGAARQYRERIDMGYSPTEAIMAHHGGDDRRMWGPKTQAYGQQVLQKAGTIGSSLQTQFQAAQPEQPPAPEQLQQKLDQEEPGRYRVLSPEEVAAHQGEQRSSEAGSGSPWRSESYIDPDEFRAEQQSGRSVSEIADDISILNQLGGSIASLPQEEQDEIAVGFWDRIPEAAQTGWENMTRSLSVTHAVLSDDFSPDTIDLLADTIREQIEHYEADEARQHPSERRIKEALEAFGETEGFAETSLGLASLLGTVFVNPKGLAIGTTEQLANMLPSVAGGAAGAGGGAAVGAVAGAPGVAFGALWGSRAGFFAGTASLEYGFEVTEAITDRLDEQGKPPTRENIAELLSDPAMQSEIKSQAARKGLTLAAVDSLFMVLAGKIGAKGLSQTSRRDQLKYGAGAVGVELAGEPTAEAASQLAARGEIDKADVAAEGIYGAGTAAGGAVVGTGSQALYDRARGRAQGRSGDQGGSDGAPQQEAFEADTAGIDPQTGEVLDQSQAPIQAEAQPEPSGPIGRAMQRAPQPEPIAQQPVPEGVRATVQTPAGDVSGTLESFADHGDGQFTARLLSDDGMIYEFNQDDNVQINQETQQAEAADPVDSGMSPEQEAEWRRLWEEQGADMEAEFDPQTIDVTAERDETEAAPEGAVVRSDGTPFQSYEQAQQAMRNRRIEGRVEQLPEGGWAILPSQDAVATTEQAETQTREETARTPDRPIEEMSEQELQDRLGYLRNQARSTGWDARLMRQRQEIETALEALAQPEPQAEAQAEAQVETQQEQVDTTTESQETSAQQEARQEVAPTGEPIVEHETRRGRTLRGVLRDIPLDEAKEIDPYAFRKDGQSFIRLNRLGEQEAQQTTETAPSSTAEAAATDTPAQELIQRRDGTPFATEATARRAATNRRLQGYEPVEVDGGWALAPQEQRAESQQASEPAPTEEPAQSTDLTEQYQDAVTQEIERAKQRLFRQRRQPETEASRARVKDTERQLRQLRQRALAEAPEGWQPGDPVMSGQESPSEPVKKNAVGDVVTLEEPMRVYHGTVAGNDFDRFDESRFNSGVGVNARDQGNQRYATTSPRAARWFSGRAEQNRRLMEGGMPDPDVRGDVLEFELAAGSRVLRVEDMPRGSQSRANEIIDQAREQGYDAVQFPDRGFDTIEGDPEVFAMLNEDGTPDTMVILNEDAMTRVREQAEPQTQAEQKASQQEGVTTTQVSEGITATVIDPSAGSRQAESQASPDADRFADNKIFTADKVEAARKRLRAKLGQINSGIDPEMLVDGMTIAGAYIESGVRSFNDYAQAMIGDLGDSVKPYLLSFYEGARNYPGLDTAGMSSVEQAQRAHAELLKDGVPEAVAEAVGEIKPRPTKRTRKSGRARDRVLTDDWGVEHIDGWTETADGQGEPSDFGLIGGVKDAFLKETQSYLRAVANELTNAGFVAATNRDGKALKSVSVNKSGTATSGDVTLTMRHPDAGVNVHASIGASSLRGTVPSTTSGVSIMFRASRRADDTYAVNGTNKWAPVSLSAADLAAMIQSEADMIAPREVRQNDTQADGQGAGRRDAGVRSESAQADEGQQDAGAVSESTDGTDAGSDQRGEAASRGSQRDGERAGVSSRRDEPDADAQQPVRRDRERGDTAGGGRDRVTGDYRIQPGELTRDRSWRKVAERNVDIVELAKRIESEGRQATPEEKQLLTKFTGWGASEIANGVFPDRHGRYKPGWDELGERLRNALTDQEYAEAQRSMQYAHYTSEGVIRSIYSGLERMGFSGGNVLEPGAGIGLFRGLMPEGVAQNSTYTAVEYDSLTGTIARLLYPQSNVIIGDYTRTKFPRDFFDAAVGNPPFAATKITNDPEYRKHGFFMHDYFFAKTIDRVKPGGVVVFVTSKGTMDKVTDRARKYLADRANLVGAIRLPQTAFKDNAGTEVVTDVLFLQKRGEGVPEGGADWLGTTEITTPQGPARINEYFAAHPEMVLGEHALTGSMYRANEYTVNPREGVDIEQAFADAVRNLPENVYRAERGSRAEAAQVADRDYNPSHRKEGGIYVDDSGALRIIEDGSGVELTHRRNAQGKEIALSDKQKTWLKDYAGVRDALKQAQYDQLNDGPWESSLQALNDAYDAFLKKHGPMLAHTVTERENDDGTITVTRRYKNKPLLDTDIESALVYAIEDIKPDGTIEKGPALKGRTLMKPAEPEIHTTQDAVFVSLNQIGRLDLDHAAGLAGISRERLIEEMGDAIYEDPTAGWVMADEYLSGNVVQKLKEAESAAKVNPSLKRNIEALRAVQPAPLSPADITVQLGSHWVPASDVTNFAAEILGDTVRASYHPIAARWSVDGDGSKISDWGHEKLGSGQILEAVLNNRQLRVTWRDSEGKTHVDAEATEAVNDKAKKMREAFKRWIWQDATRTDRLATFYNEHFNNIVPRSFDGSHLTLPGVSTRFNLYPHQKRAIWRAVQDGNTYFAHSVGAGKTFTMIAAGMEERRLGLTRKPMYVVPNHMLAQFSKEFLELYPTANIMVADEQNFHTSNRRRFVAQAALNDPDAIIITHSAFGRIGMSEEYSQSYINDQIDEMKALLDEADNSDRITRKQLERRIEQLERRLEGRQKREKKDQVLAFEELGVDRLYVDEGHEFRKLDFATQRGNIKGIDPSGSQRAMDLDMKVRYLEGRNPGRSLVMASGTPVTNTMGELYTVQRFFQSDQLAEDGLASFDAWSNQFGEVVEGFEQNAAGGYEVVSRFAKFVNVPDLMSRVRSFMDILTSDQLGELVQRPNVRGGQREIIATPTPDGYKAYQQQLNDRIKAIRQRSGPPAPGDDIILKVISDGRFSAIDMRFVDPTLPSDPNSKLNRIIDDMIAAYHETAEYEYHTNGRPDPIKGASMMMFTDIGLGEASARNRGFDMKAWIEKRLVEGGVAREHIAFMRDHKQHAKKERLFADLREGKKRILIGGKDMETGVNAQKRLHDLFHLDAPWFPASVEQREGRIVRQGNQNSEVRIRAYATKGSYDSTMWGMNARKARFIEQAMTGDSALRAMDDVSEASSFEMASALASGDERYLRLAGLKSDVERLNRLYSAHMSDQRKLRSDKSLTEGSLSGYRNTLADMEKALQQRQEIKAGSFAAEVSGQRFDNRDEFSQALFAAFKKEAEAFSTTDKTLGRIGGFDIEYTGMVMRGSNEFVASLDVAVPGDYESLLTYPIDPNTPVSGLATRAANQVNRLDVEMSRVREKVEQLERRLETIDSRIGSPFAELSELTDKQNQMAELEAELASETATADQQANEADIVDGEPRASVAPRSEGMDTAGLREMLTDGELGGAIGRLIDSGRVVLHDTALDMPARLSGARAITMPDGTIHLAADTLSADTAMPTLLHEAFHSGARALVGDRAWNDLQGRLRALYHQGERSTGRMREFWEAARDRVQYAQEMGHQMSDAIAIEEFGAYAVEEYARAPAAVKRWVDDVMGAIKAWVQRRFGRQLGAVTPAQLRSLAAAALRDAGNAEIAQTHQDIAQSLRDDQLRPSMQPHQTRTDAFRRWFGDSKVVDENGRPLVVYHGTQSGEFSVFRPSGEQNMFGTGEQYHFTDSRREASTYAEGNFETAQKGRSGTGRVLDVYLKMERPADLRVDSWNVNDVDIQGMIETQDTGGIISALQAAGYDGIIHDGELFPALVSGNHYVVFSPEQIKSATSNRGTFDPSNPDIRYSVSERNAAIAQASNDLKKAQGSRRRDFDGGVVRDLGSIANWLQHPYTIASMNPEFTPVLQVAVSQQKVRDQIISDFYPDYKRYRSMNSEGRTKVNKVLELGRLTGRTFRQSELEAGVHNPGNRVVVTYDQDGNPVRSSEPLNATLSEPNETIKLTKEEQESYLGLRSMFDRALDRFRDQILVDYGMDEFVGVQSPAKAIADSIEEGMSAAEAERRAQIAQTMQEIEQAKRTGYVPFSRYGRYAITVKEERAPITYTKNPEGGWIARGVPEAMAGFMRDIGATYSELEGGWRLNGEQRQALRQENNRTIYSEKVETDWTDRFREGRAERQGGAIRSIPRVRDAMDRIKAEWVGDNPNRRISVIDTHRKTPEGRVRLSDIDALADLTQLDNETWLSVRDQFASAIQGRGFRRHFFHADNVPGYTADFERSIGDYIGSMAGHLSRRQHERQWDNAIAGIKGRRLYKYATDYRNYMNNPQEEYAMLRQVGFFYYIAGNLSTAALNATQVPIMAVPAMAQVAPTHLVTAETTRAYRDVLKMTSLYDLYKTGRAEGDGVGSAAMRMLEFFDPNDAPADVRAELKEAWEEGYFAPQFTHEVMGFAGRTDRGAKDRFEKGVQLVSASYTYVERLNRLVTFIAAARLAKKKGVRERADKVLFNNALARHSVLGDKWSPKSFAEFMVNESQFLMGKHNRSRMLRSHGAAIFQFMSFVANSLQAWYRWSKLHGKTGKMMTAASIASIVALSGLWGAPGLDHLRDLYERAYTAITGEDQDIRTDLRRWIYEVSDSAWLSEVATKGALYPLGMDMTRRVGFMQIAPDTSSVTRSLGIPADLLVGRPTRAVQKAAQGDTQGAAAELVPTFMRNPILAHQWSQKGAQVGSGHILPDDIPTHALWYKALGFQPSLITEVRDWRYARYRAERKLDGVRMRFSDRIAKAEVEAIRNDDPRRQPELEAAIDAIWDEVDSYNEGRDRPIEITPRMIDQRIDRLVFGVQDEIGGGREDAAELLDQIDELFRIEERLSTP